VAGVALAGPGTELVRAGRWLVRLLAAAVTHAAGANGAFLGFYALGRLRQSCLAEVIRDFIDLLPERSRGGIDSATRSTRSV